MSICGTENDVGRPMSAFFNSLRVNALTAVTQALPKRPESGVQCDEPLFRYISVTLESVLRQRVVVAGDS
jgi:hypothetical protein